VQCRVVCCAVLCCAALCCAVTCCAVLWRGVICRAADVEKEEAVPPWKTPEPDPLRHKGPVVQVGRRYSIGQAVHSTGGDRSRPSNASCRVWLLF
jgi:hypothetical protein